MEDNTILADGRWNGPHGIGRFATEILARLQNADILSHGPKPLSLHNLFWQPYHLHKHKNKYKVFFEPGFNPILLTSLPFVFTLCDLIHLQYPGANKQAKHLYYKMLVKPAAKMAHRIITISEYSRREILDWTGVEESTVVNVSCGISASLSAEGRYHLPGYPYLLHVGNTKTHKNVERLLHAFKVAKIDEGIHLILTGGKSLEVLRAIRINKLENRVVFSGTLSESNLGEYYRGALGVVFPSLYEGFGLPPLEAMACGIPVITSNVTSLPEVVGDAAILINPYEIESIADGIERLVHDSEMRDRLIQMGFERSKLFSWDKTADQVQRILTL